MTGAGLMTVRTLARVLVVLVLGAIPAAIAQPLTSFSPGGPMRRTS